MTTKRSRAARPAALRMAAMAVGVALGLSACSAGGAASGPDSARAKSLAEQLNRNLTDAGLPKLDVETATTLYGTDGGVSCENAGELQHQLSLFQFGNNSNNLRRVVMDPSLIAYDLAVIETYCPNKLGSFQELVEELETEETVQ